MQHAGGQGGDGGTPEPIATADREDQGSPVVRALFMGAGLLALGLGIAGIFLPVLPTTPFILLAAACFARSHHRFHTWLLAHRLFGPMVDEWQRYRSIPYRTKIIAIATMAFTLGTSIVFFVRPLWVRVLLTVCGIGLAVWMYRIPSRDRPG